MPISIWPFGLSRGSGSTQRPFFALPSLFVSTKRFLLTWKRDGVVLSAREPDEAEVKRYAPLLSSWYNEEYNQSMMTNLEPLSPEDVCQLYQDMRSEGGRPFLLFRDDTLMGDADFRHIEEHRAEFAIMVGSRAAQGQGLGTAFSILLHSFAFRELALREVYLTIIPENQAGRRCYEKVGYRCDESPMARSYAGSEDEISMVITQEAFLRQHGAVLGDITAQALLPSGYLRCC